MKIINEKYKYTVITSTYNCGDEFNDTAISIRNQERFDIQWIVIDAKSMPETIEIINNNSDIISIFISEPDNGIYDAWNKAIRFIEGEWVIFLGAGDTLYSNTTFADIEIFLNTSKIKNKLIYGKIRLIDTNGFLLKSIGLDWKYMKNKWQNGRRMLPVHPEVFQHHSLFEHFNFDTSFKIAGDSDFLLRVIKAGYEPCFVNQYVTNMVIGGTSQDPKKHNLAKYEIDRLNLNNNIHVPFFVKKSFVIKLYLKYIIWFILGNNIFVKFRFLIKK